MSPQLQKNDSKSDLSTPEKTQKTESKIEVHLPPHIPPIDNDEMRRNLMKLMESNKKIEEKVDKQEARRRGINPLL